MNGSRINACGRLTICENWAPSELMSLFRLYRVYGGCAYFRGRPLLPGHLYILPPGNRQDWRLGESFDHLFFDFFTVPPLILRDPVDIKVDTYPALDALCTAASAVFADPAQQRCDEVASGLLTALLGLCKQIVPLSVISDPRIADTVDHICACYRSDGGTEPADLSLEALAKRVHLDPGWFLKLFRAQVGQTPGSYIRELRLAHAVMLLREGMPAVKVAERVGFGSCAAFSTAFKKRFGVSPGRLG